jgi:hypothetical protein
LATPLLPKGGIENKFNDWLMRPIEIPGVG